MADRNNYDPVALESAVAFLEALLASRAPLVKVENAQLASVPEVMEWIAEVDRQLRERLRRELSAL